MKVFRASNATPFITKDDSEIRVVVDRTNSPITALSLAEATVPPRGVTAWHRLEGIDEIYYVLHGHGRMEVDGETAEIGPGDAVWMPAGSRQRIRNLSDDPLVFLCACGPAYEPARDVRQE